MRHEYPTLLNLTNNMTAKVWIRKISLKPLIAKVLQRIICSITMNNLLGLGANHIDGSKNIAADAISRVYSNSNVPHSIDSLLKTIPKFITYRCFHPSPKLLSHLYSALYSEQKRGLSQISTYGRFRPGKIISKPSSMNSK